jgi:hypothetical protein
MMTKSLFKIRKREHNQTFAKPSFAPALRAVFFAGTILSCSIFLCASNVIADDELVPLKPKLPAAAFVGTPKDAPAGSNIESASDKSKQPLMIPKDAVNLAPKAQITTSDANAKPEILRKITDGIKEADDANLVLLRKGPQYVQFDFNSPQQLFAIVIWHAHDTPKVYHGVVVQLADDAGFTANVRTLFNNDLANAVGRGAGTDHEYFESFEGKTIDVKGEPARYVRLYSKGSSDGSFNEYTEVEIYGRPMK